MNEEKPKETVITIPEGYIGNTLNFVTDRIPGYRLLPAIACCNTCKFSYNNDGVISCTLFVYNYQNRASKLMPQTFDASVDDFGICDKWQGNIETNVTPA